MTLRSAAILTGLLALSQLLIGCVGTRPGRGLVTLHGIETANPGKPWTVDIQSVQGRVEVEVDRELTLPRVLAKAPSQTNAKDPAIYVGAIAGATDTGNVLQISVSPATVGGAPTPVSLLVRVPLSNGVRVHNSGGGVRLSGVSGNIEVMSGVPLGVGGPIFVSTESNLTDGVKLITSKGNILLMMGQHSGGVMEVRGTKGISVELPASGATGVTLGTKQWKGAVGSNAAQIYVASEDGASDVRFGQQKRDQATHGK